MAINIKSLLTRTLSGIIYIGIIIFCVLTGKLAVSIMAAVFSTIAVIEFSKICKDLNENTIPTLLLDIAGCIALSFMAWGYPVLIWIAIMIARFIEELYIRSKNPIRNLAHSYMSQIYIGMPLGVMSVIGCLYNFHLLLAIFIFIWMNDTGAFLVGSTMGRHRLFERISPKKSWEGFFGGLLFNLILAAVFCLYCTSFFEVTMTLGSWLGLAAVVTLFATWGDLGESLIKRTLKIKDSGNIIPGHGGILDRIDSLLLVIPATFLYLLIISIENLIGASPIF